MPAATVLIRTYVFGCCPVFMSCPSGHSVSTDVLFTDVLVYRSDITPEVVVNFSMTVIRHRTVTRPSAMLFRCKPRSHASRSKV